MFIAKTMTANPNGDLSAFVVPRVWFIFWSEAVAVWIEIEKKN